MTLSLLGIDMKAFKAYSSVVERRSKIWNCCVRCAQQCKSWREMRGLWSREGAFALTLAWATLIFFHLLCIIFC